MNVLTLLALVLSTALGLSQDAQGTLRIRVVHDGAAVAGASVTINDAKHTTDAAGSLTANAAAGTIRILVTKNDFADLETTLTLLPGETKDVTIELQGEFEETVTVSATRTETRLEDQPMRVEVVPGEEVQEKIMMTPGDISMLLNETNGLRVQTTSPSLGGANVRIQGLRGKYTQVVADGLPLYGGQTGSIGILQIPPMDLGQVEIIKGVASALYGMSAIGGVVNLISRRPPESGHEREILVNGTTHGGTDLISWLASPINDSWGYTFLGGLHAQRRSDLDADGWTDLPAYERVVARPRFFWNDGAGRSLIAALGAMSERRRGGTLPGRAAPDGGSFPENLDTKRFDAGAVWRTATASGHVVTARGSATAETRAHAFGNVVEDDGHRTSFGEISVMKPSQRQTWVIGAAVQADRYRSQAAPRFDYTYVVPGAFVQEEVRVTPALTLSGSARLDRHSRFGTFLSPQGSALVRPADEWTVRVSAGRGHFAPTPFTDETDVTGLSGIAPLGALETERATNVMADVTWKRRPFDITATVFASRIERPLDVRETGRVDDPLEIVNLDGPARTRGTELIAHYRKEGDIDVIATHMFLLSSEPFEGGRRDVALNPRHSASFDLLKQIGPARIGFEVFYTGRQAVDENPYRQTGSSQVLFGGLVDWAIGRSRIYVNIENVGDVRQTKKDPLVKPMRGADGRWTVDAWAPLEGRTVNAGVRWRF